MSALKRAVAQAALTRFLPAQQQELLLPSPWFV
jgi:hypothetical protein